MIDKIKLITLANEKRANSYAPYSNYTVGASLLASSGRIYTGVNVENASYPATICAERSAVAQAISEGDSEFLAIAISAGKNDSAPDGATPCGICRQVLSEFCKVDLTVLIATADGYKEYTLGELFPDTFTLKK